MKKERFETLNAFIKKYGNPWIPQAPFDGSQDAELLIYTYGHELLAIPLGAEDYRARVQASFQAVVNGAWTSAINTQYELSTYYSDQGRSRTEERVYHAAPNGVVSNNNSTGSETVNATSAKIDHLPDDRYFEANDAAARIRLFAPLFLGVL